MKKIIALALSAMMLLSLFSLALAEDYTPGVTVTANPDSKTGYTATIVYEAPGAEKVYLAGSFAFHLDDGSRGKEPETYYVPADWTEDMFAIGQESHKEEMTKVEGTDYFVISYDLPSGHYQYCFYVDDAETRVDDPTNPGEYAKVENGGAYTRSVFDVPYDEKQGKSQDYAYAAKRADDQVGQMTYVNYTDIDGNAASLGVYLPYGYDANREEPYKVLYLSHGAGGDETFWIGGGSAANIFDNLIANGEMEPTVLVTMNNTTYGWDFEKIGPNTVDCIVPFVEANYNVCKETSGKAFAGLSMGAITTSRMFRAYPDQFAYFGMFSGGDSSQDFTTQDIELLKKPTIMTGAGIYDFLYQGNGMAVKELNELFDKLGIQYTNYDVNGAHEWFTWIQLLHIFGGQYLWK